MSDPSPGVVILAQLFFGVFFVATGGWLAAEPSLTLTRDDRGLVGYHYVFNAYGRLPVIERRLEDLVRCEITESHQQVARPDRISSAVTSRSVESSNLVCSTRNGDSFTTGNAFRAPAIRSFLESPEERVYRERIEATALRLYGGIGAGLFGGLLLLGAVVGVVGVLAGSRGRP